MNAPTKPDTMLPALQMPEGELIQVLKSSLYPGAKDESVRLVLGYCKASGLDPMKKPVHIVPMWDSKAQEMRDVIMPGVGLYRTDAARSGKLAGISEPFFGPDVTRAVGGAEITFPEWCRVTVKRKIGAGEVADFTAVEYWTENYAVKGGKEKSVAPNAMWMKRPRGQLAKCAQAQALRMAFPEAGAAPTAEEMEGKTLDADTIDAATGEIKQAVTMPQSKSAAAAKTDVTDVPFTEETSAKPPAPPATQTGGTILVGQVKHLEMKIKALELGDEAIHAMLARHGAKALDTTMTTVQFDAVRAELLSMA